MTKWICLLLLIGAMNTAQSQVKKKVFRSVGDTISRSKDSLILKDELNSELSTNIPVISIEDIDAGNVGAQSVSSALTASRDAFLFAATFNFSIARFKPRGYELSNSNLYISGVPIENLENGSGSQGVFGGLTFVLHNRDYTLGIRPNTFGFGGIGSNVNINVSPSEIKKRTEIGYSYSDRTYTHRYSFTHSSGLSKKGWAYIVSLNRRWSDESYVAGTYINDWSYFIGVDKKINDKRTISLTVFGAPSETGEQSRVVKEADSLLGTHYYNPDWGYQNGKKRNANVLKSHQPYIILTDERKFNNSSSLVNAASLSFGKRGISGLDYQNAAVPFPDYYQYLPSYYLNPAFSSYSPSVAQYVAQQFKANHQINWQQLYNVNRSNFQTIDDATVNGVPGQTYSGLQSAYILGESITNSQKANFSSTYNTRLGNRTNFSAGLILISQNDHNYKKVDDLLGGQYFVDINEYAIGSFPSNPLVQYPNLAKPNNIAKTGDTYSYDYNAHINKAQVWSQGVFKFNQFDFFVAGQFSNTQFWRVGNWQSGLYPNNSLGKSTVYNFDNFGFKGGFTYKIDGRNYLYLNGSYSTNAPEFRNVFLSPSNRDQVQNNITNENISSVEGGYIINSPGLRLKLSGYYTEFTHQMNVLSFFNEDYYTYTNYALTNISKVHYGGELGFEAEIAPQVTVIGAASIGRYYYNSREYASVVNDNTQGIIASDTIYSKNYRVDNTPQEAYSLGIQYISKNHWYIRLTGNYFDQIWASFNPIRLTKSAVSDVTPHSAAWYGILNQEQFPSEFTMDILAGYTWKLPRNFLHKSSSLLFSGGINNLINNKNIINGGAQLRYEETAPTEFPSKYAYALGLTYTLNATLRF
jgi:hypothetical protein